MHSNSISEMLFTPSTSTLVDPPSVPGPASEAPPGSRRSSPHDWDFIKLIGTGSSAKVFLTRHHKTRQPAALKIILKSSPTADFYVLQEQRIHANLTNHMRECIIPLQATFHDSTYFYLAMDYLPGGDLAEEIKRCGMFSRKRAQLYCAELVLILEKLHSQRVVHRDLKPANILIRKDGYLALADFGLCYDSQSPSRGGTGVTKDPLGLDPDYDDSLDSDYITPTSFDYAGTPLYMSPAQHRTANYSFDADWWALGVILYYMLTGRLPFASGDTSTEVAFSVILQRVIFEQKDELDVESMDLIEKLLHKKRPDRLCDPTKIKAHPFFSGLNWDKVESKKYTPEWKPKVDPIPKAGSMETIPIDIGTELGTLDDHYPAFTWVSPEFNVKTRHLIQSKVLKTVKSVGNLVRKAVRID